MSLVREVGALLVTIVALLAAGFAVLVARLVDRALDKLGSSG